MSSTGKVTEKKIITVSKNSSANSSFDAINTNKSIVIDFKNNQKNPTPTTPNKENKQIQLEDVKTLEHVANYVKLNKTFVDSVAKAENFHPTLYYTEKNIGGEKVKIPTIGYGHQVTDKELNKYNKNTVITKAEACKILAKDLKAKKDELSDLLEKDSKGKRIPDKDLKVRLSDLNNGQFEALHDLVFQCGKGTLQNSLIIKHLKEGKIDEAVAGFRSFITYKGEANDGMARRRLQNIYDFTKEKPTVTAFKTMTEINIAVMSAYDKKIQAATNKKEKISLMSRKNLYKKDALAMITKLENEIKKPSKQTKETAKAPSQPSLFDKIKAWFN